MCALEILSYLAANWISKLAVFLSIQWSCHRANGDDGDDGTGSQPELRLTLSPRQLPEIHSSQTISSSANMVNPIPPKYVLASLVASLSGLANGLDTGCIGGIIHMPQFTATVGKLSATMLGFTVSLIMLAGVLPSIFAGHVADRFGRIRTTMFGSWLYTAAMVLEGSATGLPQFLAGRVLAGIGQAFSLGNASVYVCEIAPARSRGTLSSMPQLLACAGVCWGYFLCYSSSSLEGSIAWRLGFIAQTINSASLFFLCFLLPESPRWLLLMDRRADAIRPLERLQFSMVEAERDFLSATDTRPTLTLWQSYVLIFRRHYRARTILGLFVLGMVQLSGIDGVIYVSRTSSHLCEDLANLGPVRTHPLRAGRPRLEHGRLPCLRHLLNTHPRRHDPRPPNGRQMGPQDICHQRRHRPRRVHATHRVPLRRRRRTPQRRHALGRHRRRLRLWHDLLRYVGYRRQDIRQRDTAVTHAWRGELSRHGAQLLRQLAGGDADAYLARVLCSRAVRAVAAGCRAARGRRSEGEVRRAEGTELERIDSQGVRPGGAALTATGAQTDIS